jgi:hypothetical protein
MHHGASVGNGLGRLHRLIPGIGIDRHFINESATKQCMYGLARRLAKQVPERDFYGAHRRRIVDARMLGVHGFRDVVQKGAWRCLRHSLQGFAQLDDDLPDRPLPK